MTKQSFLHAGFRPRIRLSEAQHKYVLFPAVGKMCKKKEAGPLLSNHPAPQSAYFGQFGPLEILHQLQEGCCGPLISDIDLEVAF